MFWKVYKMCNSGAALGFYSYTWFPPCPPAQGHPFLSLNGLFSVAKMLLLWRVTICSTSFKAGTCNKPTARVALSKQSRLGSEQKEATPSFLNCWVWNYEILLIWFRLDYDSTPIAISWKMNHPHRTVPPRFWDQEMTIGGSGSEKLHKLTRNG